MAISILENAENKQEQRGVRSGGVGRDGCKGCLGKAIHAEKGSLSEDKEASVPALQMGDKTASAEATATMSVHRVSDWWWREV